jgi:altronate hydrolase
VKAVLIISASDNVATALEPPDVGRTIEIAARRIEIRDAIPAGHKVALAPIVRGRR